MAGMANRAYWLQGDHIQRICVVIVAAYALYQPIGHHNQQQLVTTIHQHIVP
jgi:hypothetical protein